MHEYSINVCFGNALSDLFTSSFTRILLNLSLLHLRKPFSLVLVFLLFHMTVLYTVLSCWLKHGSTALINAAAGARNAIVKLLLEAGADKDARAVVRHALYGHVCHGAATQGSIFAHSHLFSIFFKCIFYF